MTERETLLLVFVLVYLAECLFWARRGAVIFRSLLGNRWHLVHPHPTLGNHSGGFAWANPLPPFGVTHAVSVFPFSVSPLGVLAHSSESPNPAGRPVHTEQFFRWEQIQSINSDGKKLLINDTVFWRGGSVYAPLQLARWLREMAATPETGRALLIEKLLKERFDLNRLESRRAEVEEHTHLLLIACELMFFFLFLICPVTVWLHGWLPALWWMIPVLMGLAGVITTLFIRGHRKLYPDAGDERFRLAFVFALAPAAAIRACDSLSRSALESFHPLTAARALLGEAAFEGFAIRTWRDLHFPMLPVCASNEPAAVATEAWFRERQRAALDLFLKHAAVATRFSIEPLAPTEASHTRFCPRCEAEFTSAASVCGDCGGRALETFNKLDK